MTMSSQFTNMTSSSTFWRWHVSLVKSSFWSKFHVKITAGSRVITIFLYEGFIRNPEIGNTPVWVLPNISRLGRVRDTKFGANIFNEMQLNAANTRVTAFTFSELLREKQLGEVKLPPRTQFRVIHADTLLKDM